MNKPDVKERIIQVASDLFYFQGYSQTGINQIISEAHVAKASMYQHFKSKEDLAVAYLQRKHTEWITSLFTFIEPNKGNNEKLIACFDFLKQWMEEVSFTGCGFQNISCDLPKEQHKIKDQVVLHKNEIRKWIHALLTEDVRLSKKQAENLGDEIVVLLEGAIIVSKIQKNTWPIVSAQKTCIRLLS